MPDPTITVRGRGEFSRLDRDLNRLQGRTTSTMSKIGRATKVGLAIGAGALVKFGLDSVKSLARIERINAQTAAAIKSTGGAANVSLPHIDKLVHKLEDLTATEAETTQENANLLLTFTKVQNAAGKGNKIYDRTVKTFVDMQRAIPSASMTQLGRALNDPVKGMAALTRVGVQFDDQQRKQITRFAENNKLMKAQKVILGELTTEFGGSGRAFAATTEGKIAKAKDALGDFGEEITRRLLPAIGDLADKGTAGLEKLTEHSDDIEDTAKSLFGLGKDIAEVVIPPAKTLGGIAVDLAKFLGDLPDPVQKFGIQAGIAALLVSKLNTAVSTSAKTGLVGYVAGLKDAETRTAKLGAAARNAAGIGGMLLLAHGTQQANKELRYLEGIAGGALLGFSAGGPWGAAIGAGAGLIATLATNTDGAAAAMAAAKENAKQYAGTLDQVSGAAKNATVEMVAMKLQQEGAFTLASKLGIGTRDLVRATLGNEAALKRVNAATALTGETQEEVFARLKKTGDQFSEAGKKEYALAAAADELRQVLGLQSGAIENSRKQTQELSIASGKLARSLKDVKGHSKIVARVQSEGWPKTIEQVARLTRGLKLTPKEQKILFRALNVDGTVNGLERVRKKMRETSKTPVDPSTFVQSVKNLMSVGGGIVDRGGKGVKKGLRDSGKTKVDDSWLKDLTSSLTTGKGRASTGGREIGNNLKTGVLSGIGGLESLLSGQVTSAVNAAIAAGRRAADAHSPSRKMFALGQDMADGAVAGLRSRDSVFVGAGQSVVRKILDGIGRANLDDVRGALGKLNDLIEKTYAKRFKNEKRAREETKKALKSIRDEERAIRRNGKLREQIARKLERAEQKLQDLVAQRADYSNAVKQAALDFANITNLDTAFNADALAAGLQKRLEKLRQFADGIAQLTALGLNKVSLDQLIAGGVEGSLAEVLALLQGGGGAIDQINNIQDQINQVADQMGDSTASTMYDAGIQAAEGLVKGLEARRKDLEKIGRQLARDLIKALKEELGIRSPSSVFRGLGKQTALGLTIGLEDVHVKRAGAVLAGELLDGFGRPVLNAAAVTNGIGSTSPTAGQVLTVNVRLTAEQASLVQQGRSVTIAIDAYKAAGGKVRAG